LDVLVINVLDKGYVRFVDKMGSDLSVTNAARTSYDKESAEFSQADERLLNFLLREGHTSPLRHAAMTFEVYAPLLVARQWWKYAVASSHIDDQNGWNESSRRYITEDEQFYIPEPGEWRTKPENSKQGSGPTLKELGLGIEALDWTAELEKHVDHSLALYDAALDAGIAPEQARLFLPAYGMYVRWRWTTSLAGVLHFLSQRLEHDAQYEIQEYARAIQEYVQLHFPNTWRAYESNTKSA
jgi:thymidylate synthase (FAD)